MIPPSRLAKLHGMGRIRKCALEAEKAQRAWPTPGSDPTLAKDALAGLRGMAEFLLAAEESPPELREASSSFLRDTGGQAWEAGFLRALDRFRHALRRISGQSSADWDLIDPAELRSSGPSPESRLQEARAPTGRRLYLEDLRSPFNVGTIFRTAEAFGFDEILLSPDSADPSHPRARRSSMGTVDRIPWRRVAVEDLADLAGGMGGLLALELGGIPLGSFAFPPRGILVLGSEELGVSEPLLRLAGMTRVSIPMHGNKASLNVAVAFGIAANAWAMQAELRP